MSALAGASKPGAVAAAASGLSAALEGAPGLTPELEGSLRGAIKPQYENIRGTESYERRRLLGEIDRLRALLDAALELAASHGADVAQVQMLGQSRFEKLALDHQRAVGWREALKKTHLLAKQGGTCAEHGKAVLSQIAELSEQVLGKEPDY